MHFQAGFLRRTKLLLFFSFYFFKYEFYLKRCIAVVRQHWKPRIYCHLTLGRPKKVHSKRNKMNSERMEISVWYIDLNVNDVYWEYFFFLLEVKINYRLGNRKPSSLGTSCTSLATVFGVYIDSVPVLETKRAPFVDNYAGPPSLYSWFASKKNASSQALMI